MRHYCFDSFQLFLWYCEVQVHMDYLEAGADIIITASYQVILQSEFLMMLMS